MTNKTLIGKNNYLFLINDSGDELNIHCNNILKITDMTLSRYKNNNIIFFIYPNKCLIYKDYLPSQYNVKYRPAFDVYKQKFKHNLYDLYDILKNEEDIYYKTDTHINIKGNYVVYKFFIKIINKRLNLNLKYKHLDLSVINCELKTLPYGIGDLTWDTNLGNQHLDDIKDNFYFNDQITCFYCIYKIDTTNNIKFLNSDLIDNTNNMEREIVTWDIVSKYIIYIKNDHKINLKILIFYDSFLLHALPLYFYLFNEIYFVKNHYSYDLIEKIKPDYVFEFRVERFLV